jgi:hypothetical protein
VLYIYYQLHLITFKTLRLKWLGHVKWMEDHREPNTALHIPGGGRRRGKPRKRWLDDVEDDFRKTEVKRWRIKAMDRTKGEKYVRRPRSSRSVEPCSSSGSTSTLITLMLLVIKCAYKSLHGMKGFKVAYHVHKCMPLHLP